MWRRAFGQSKGRCRNKGVFEAWLAALALFLRAKAFNKNATLTDSNLACADVAIFRGQHLAAITKEMALPPGVTRDLFEKFRDSLEEAATMGSLVRLERRAPGTHSH